MQPRDGAVQGHGSRGFTLVELMIVVAIIMVLASIALPNFYSMQLRTKRAELPMMLSGIKDSAIAYSSSYDVSLNANYNPDNTPTKTQRAWVTATNFATIGFAPDGMVRGSYSMGGGIQNGSCGVGGAGCIGGGDYHCIKGWTNVDGEGNQACAWVDLVFTDGSISWNSDPNDY